MKKALKDMLAHKDDAPDDEVIDPENMMVSRKDAARDDVIIFKFRKYLTKLKKTQRWSDLRARSTCNKCGDPADEPMVTSCMHLYCTECLRSMAVEAAAKGKEATPCSACGVEYTEARPCPALKELEVDDIPLLGQKSNEDGTPTERPRRTAKDNMKWCDMDGQVLPSTKTAAVQVQVEKWLKDFPKTKIIVFSQFHLS